MTRRLFPVLLLAALLSPGLAAPEKIAAPSPELVEAWQLSPQYTQFVSVEGLPVLASAKVSPYALGEAAFLIHQMVGHRPEILRAMAANRVRFVVMAATEMTTDVPEHSDLTPKSYWDRRARGLGATAERPAVSCGEENLLDLPGDPYAAENILIHEFAHAIHERGLSTVDPTFDTRLLATYDAAKSAGLWKGTYAMENRMEYWAEAAQSWFDCNRANDREHGPIDTRDKLKSYDPAVAKLCAEVFGDTPWRYTKTAKRPEAERAHLAGFDVTQAGRFSWPKDLAKLGAQGTPLAWLSPASAPSATPRGGSDRNTTILFINRRSQAVSIDWLDFDGRRKPYATVRPGVCTLQNTHPGHVWMVSDSTTDLGVVVATEKDGRVEIGDGYESRTLEGWSVRVSERLLRDDAAATAKALDLIAGQLRAIVRVVPAPAVAELRKVPLWISPEYLETRPHAEYHPDPGWLREHGRNPAMAGAVEFTNVRIFEAECRRMPVLVLHELAHAYHHRVLGHDHAGIKAAFASATASGIYDRVLRQDSEGRRRYDRAYALSNPQEYFAETTEAFFGQNDFFPFTRAELEKHDPEMCKVLAEVWKTCD